MSDEKEMYQPKHVRADLVRIGKFVLGTIQVALIVGIAHQAKQDRHPVFKFARRTLAAWLSPDEWQRHSFNYVSALHWHTVAESLYRAGFIVGADPFGFEDGPLFPHYKLTAAGEALAVLMSHTSPPPLSGKDYKAFIDAKKGVRNAVHN